MCGNSWVSYLNKNQFTGLISCMYLSGKKENSWRHVSVYIHHVRNIIVHWVLHNDAFFTSFYVLFITTKHKLSIELNRFYTLYFFLISRQTIKILFTFARYVLNISLASDYDIFHLIMWMMIIVFIPEYLLHPCQRSIIILTVNYILNYNKKTIW